MLDRDENEPYYIVIPNHDFYRVYCEELGLGHNPSRHIARPVSSLADLRTGIRHPDVIVGPVEDYSSYLFGVFGSTSRLATGSVANEIRDYCLAIGKPIQYSFGNLIWIAALDDLDGISTSISLVTLHKDKDKTPKKITLQMEDLRRHGVVPATVTDYLLRHGSERIGSLLKALGYLPIRFERNDNAQKPVGIKERARDEKGGGSFAQPGKLGGGPAPYTPLRRQYTRRSS